MTEIKMMVRFPNESKEQDLGSIEYEPSDGFYFRNLIPKELYQKELYHINLSFIFQRTELCYVPDGLYYAFNAINMTKRIPEEGIYILPNKDQKAIIFMVQYDYNAFLTEKYGPEIVISLSHFNGSPQYPKENLEVLIKKIFHGLRQILFFKYESIRFNELTICLLESAKPSKKKRK